MHVEKKKAYKIKNLVAITVAAISLFSVRLHRPTMQAKGGGPYNLFYLFKVELSQINKFNKNRYFVTIGMTII